MHPRHLARELALQVLFLWDSAATADPALADDVIRAGNTTLDAAEGLTTEPSAEVRSMALEMARGAWDGREVTDARLERHAPQWPPRRQPGVDRAILRLAVWELSNARTEPKVVLDEAIELAKRFSTEHSPPFINGVLDAIHKENQAMLGGLPPAPAGPQIAQIPAAAAAPATPSDTVDTAGTAS